MFGVYLPVGILFVLGHRASQLSGLARWTCLAGAALGGTSAALGFPGVPESPPEAVGAALTGVALLWVAGTRSLLEDR